MSGVLQFILHYIDVVEKGVTFFGPRCVVTSASGLCATAWRYCSVSRLWSS